MPKKRAGEKTAFKPRTLQAVINAGVGHGHGGHTRLPDLIHADLTPEMAQWLEPGAQLYFLGECSVIIARHPIEGDWHMSIANKTRYPTWDEIAFAWYRLTPKDTPGQLALPLERDYINVHEYCMQVREDRFYEKNKS